MAAAVNLPVYMRIGATEECHIGDVEIDVDGDGTIEFGRPELAAMMRAAADEIEHPAVDDEEPT